MAGSINKVILVGRAGKDPAIRLTNGGDKVASFSLATSESWRDKATGEKREKTDWHDVVVWNPHLAEVVEKYVKKGSLIGVEGKLEKRKWTDQQGAERWSTEVVLTRFRGELTLLAQAEGDGGGASRGGDNRASAASNRRSVDDELDSDIPF